MRIRDLLALLSGIGLFAIPTDLDSCAIAPAQPVFSTMQGPAHPRNEFARGRIGVIQPSYRKPYLIGAYRILSGVKFSNEEVDALYPGKKQPAPVDQLFDAPALGAWQEARNHVPGLAPATFLQVYRSKTGNGVFYYYPNCLDDSFDSARRALEQRARLWGYDSPRLREWVTAQDQVFGNCGGTALVLPDAAKPGMDPLLAFDREYQIAAAYFYAGEWQKAREGFERIVRNAASPARNIAPYLVARTYIREGTVEGKTDALREAERRLAAISRDPARKEWHSASLRLLDYVRLRLDPQPRLKELGAGIARPAMGSKIGEATTDFIYLFERTRDAAKLASTSDLADWLLAFNHPATNTGQHALEQWRKTNHPAWLIAALVRAQDDKQFADALQDARGIQPNAPEYESAAYYGIASEIASGDHSSARLWADEVLKQKLLVSTRNLVLAERLKLARDWTEFLRYAPRKPEPKLESYDGSEQSADKPPVPTGTAPLFDTDSMDVFNSRIPLDLWLNASGNSILPAHLQLQIAQTGWVRAVLLNQYPEARKLMERISEIQPKWAPVASEYLSAADGEPARFAATFLMLRTPALRPFLHLAPGQIADLGKPERVGAGWWGFGGNCWSQDLNRVRANKPNADFLTLRERQEGENEWKQLNAALPSGSNYLANDVVHWTRNHAEDTRVPEALYLAIQATRRGCKDAATGALSRQAFVQLKQRYPKSEWARNTKYWYR